jgi:hypothetical protein
MRHVLRALEHHVFEQVREACAARLLVGWTDVVPEIDRDQRQAAIFHEYDLQAIGQRELLHGQLRCLGKHGLRRCSHRNER